MKITLGLVLVATVSAHFGHICPYAKRQQQVGPNTGNNAVPADNGSELAGQAPNANGDNGLVPDNTGAFGQVPAGNNNGLFPSGDNTGFGNGQSPLGDNTGLDNQFPSDANTGLDNQFPSGDNAGFNQFPSDANTGFNQFPSDANTGFNQFPTDSNNLQDTDALLNSLVPTAPSQQQSTLDPNNNEQSQSIPSSIFDDLPGFLGLSFPGQVDPDATITPQSQNNDSDENGGSPTNVSQSLDSAQDTSDSSPMLPRHPLVITALLILIL
ncbi:hypothetical protein GGH12_005175 [Coemansia sp. RSA 1822]|nr:hypothetical protein LPJ76_000984 [Coemansia sp. RSA 638]KAJ2559981.1 hypothetical protein GGH12_005175 [Coemansia sp. RSA 1822]